MHFSDVILSWLPKKNWNLFSRLISALTLPTIGSPIQFSYKGFTLKEYDLQTLSKEQLDKYFRFCYPADEIEDPKKELEIDRQYWPSSATFIVTRNCDSKIVGTIQLVAKNEKAKLPVEFSKIAQDQKENCSRESIFEMLPQGRYAEIYRCRKDLGLSGGESLVVVPMLFKAALAKLFQKNIDFSILSFDSENRSLRNLYCKKLMFKKSGVSVIYQGCDKKWEVLYIPTAFFNADFASVSRTHFKLITFFRSNLKKKQKA